MDDDELWAEFLEYLGRAPASAGLHPGVLFQGFRADVEQRGISPDVAAEYEQRARTSARGRSDWAATMFDRIYTSADAGFSLEPNDLVVRTAAGRPAGSALDVAMGQGRNAVHLAGAGWRVTGFDLSPAGVAAAEAAATAQGTPIDAVVASADSFDYGVARWDLIVMTYALVPVTEPAFADRIIGALAPGGLVVVESFAAASDGPSRPVDIDPDALRAAYATLQETEFGLEETVADWTLAPASVVRLAARRPG